MAEAESVEDGVKHVKQFENALLTSHNKLEEEFVKAKSFLRTIKGAKLSTHEVSLLMPALQSASTRCDEYKKALSEVKEILTGSQLDVREIGDDTQRRDVSGRLRADSGIYSADSRVLSSAEQHFEEVHPTLITQPTDSVASMPASRPVQHEDEKDKEESEA